MAPSAVTKIATSHAPTNPATTSTPPTTLAKTRLSPPSRILYSISGKLDFFSLWHVPVNIETSSSTLERDNRKLHPHQQLARDLSSSHPASFKLTQPTDQQPSGITTASSHLDPQHSFTKRFLPEDDDSIAPVITHPAESLHPPPFSSLCFGPDNSAAAEAAASAGKARVSREPSLLEELEQDHQDSDHSEEEPAHTELPPDFSTVASSASTTVPVDQENTKAALPTDTKDPASSSKDLDDGEPPPPYTEGSSPIPSFTYIMASAGGPASIITQVGQGGQGASYSSQLACKYSCRLIVGTLQLLIIFLSWLR